MDTDTDTDTNKTDKIEKRHSIQNDTHNDNETISLMKSYWQEFIKKKIFS